MKRAQRTLLFPPILLAIFFPPIQASGEQEDPIISLADCEKIAIENHASIRLAKEEVNVSRAKAQEALRALFPSLTAKAEQTRGRAEDPRLNPDFTEKSYGIELVQPIFQGGRLVRMFKQSHANLEAGRARLIQAEQGVIYRVRESFWNLVKTRRVLDIHSRALGALDQEMAMADRLLQNDVITPQTYMAVNARHQQMVLQLESAKAEEQLRLWEWTEALGRTSPPKGRPDPDFKIPMPGDLSLEECLNVARTHPELKAQSHVFAAAREGFLASGSRLWPHLDFNGFFGESSAGFKSETLNFKEDWQLGFKFSMQFGASTAQTSGFRQKTSPRIGQSSRTELETAAVTVGILDGLRSRSEQREAKFAYHQAQARVGEMEMEILNRVREAYSGWRKALAQLKISENELALALTDLSVAEIKSNHREASISERSLARVNLTQAEIAVAEARCACLISLAALNLAMGVVNKP